jgi:GAF domain-containing protein
VVTLMVNKLEQLAPATQKVLWRAACIGHEFDLRTLCIIHEKPPGETAAELWEALREGLVVPLDSEYRFLESSGGRRAVEGMETPVFDVSYKFLHDRVQEAAYRLIEEAHKQRVHLRIGRLMLAQSEDPLREGRVLDIVRHLHFGAGLMTDPGERLSLSRLSLAAGRKAKVSAAYEAAAGFFEAGASVLPATSWEDEYELTYSLHVEWAECEYLSKRLDRAESLFDLLLSRARSVLEKAHIQNLRIVRYSLLYQVSDALKAAKDALLLFGIELPEEEQARQAAAAAELSAVEKNLAGRRIQDLIEAPPMTDPEKLAVMKILVDVLVATYNTSPSLLVYVTAMQVNLSLQHGHSIVSPYSYMNYGFILAAAMGRYAEAYEYGKLAIELHDKLQNTAFTCNLYLLFFCTISFYQRPLRESIPYFRRAFDAGLVSGDFVPLSFACQHGTMIRLGLGDELDAVGDETERFISLNKRLKNANVVAWLLIIKQMIANLKGRTYASNTLNDASFDEERLLAEMTESGYAFTVPWYYIVKLEVLFFHGEYAGALSMACEADKRIGIHMRMFSTTELPFYHCLTLMALYPAAVEEERQRYMETFLTQHEKLKILAEACPENFEHKYLLAAAALAGVQGEETKATDLYERAIESAHENGFLHHEALASELAAKFYLTTRKKKIARVYMTDAYNGYLRWGATAKAEGLASKYSHLLAQSVPAALPATTSTTRRVLAELLDMKALLRAAQAIASEIVFEQVLDRWMKIVIENAGAQKGVLVLHRDNKLWIEAAITVDPDTIRLGLALPLEQATEIALSIVQYVARTREPVISNDPSRDARFARDAYVIAARPKSILSLAMTHQGRLIGILYLENNTAYEAFTPARLELLGLLASQAAIAVDNALLYAHVQSVTEELKRANETLEHQVEHRTNELRRTTEELQQANERLQLELTERARSEQAHVALQEEIIRVQTERLAELASPLIPISEQIMVMPLVGTMDEQRAQQVLETALQGVQTNQTRVVIIDITGVKRVDAAVAGTLVKMAQGLRLLGAQVMLTGIGPSVATTLIELGIDLQTIITRSTLQSAIAYAMGQSSRPHVASSTAKKLRSPF